MPRARHPWCCTPGRSSSGCPSPAPTATTSRTPHCSWMPRRQPLAVYRKIHRFGFGAGEPRLMEAGDDVVVTEIPSGTGGSVTAGLSTCYDLRFPELYRAAGGRRAPSCSSSRPPGPRRGWATGPCSAGPGPSRTSASSCSATPPGTHAGYEMGGHSQVVTATGEVLAEAAGQRAAGALGRGRPRRPRRRTARPSRCSTTAASSLARPEWVRKWLPWRPPEHSTRGVDGQAGRGARRGRDEVAHHPTGSWRTS